MNITFDNVGLSSGQFFTEGIKHESSAPREMYMYTLARERGSVMVDSRIQSKEITIYGRIKADNQQALEQAIDSFKELLSREDKTLDIEYATGTRRYRAYATQPKINREFFHVSYAPFEATFIVPVGVGEDINATVSSIDNITLATKTGTLTVGGSTFPTPKIQLSIDSAVAATAVSFQCNGDKITLTKTLAASDVIVFDTENKKVTVNGSEQEYVGMFPKFAVGDNAWQIDVTRTSCQYDLLFTYTKKWL